MFAFCFLSSSPKPEMSLASPSKGFGKTHSRALLRLTKLINAESRFCFAECHPGPDNVCRNNVRSLFWNHASDSIAELLPNWTGAMLPNCRLLVRDSISGSCWFPTAGSGTSCKRVFIFLSEFHQFLPDIWRLPMASSAAGIGRCLPRLRRVNRPFACRNGRSQSFLIPVIVC